MSKRKASTPLPRGSAKRTNIGTAPKFDDTPFFMSTLEKAGLVFDTKKLTFKGITVRRNLNTILKSAETQKNFTAQLCKFIESNNLKLALCPLGSVETEAPRFAAQDTLMKVLLGVDSIQPLIVTALIERIPDFIDEDGGKKDSIPRLILSQFRWLDKIVDSKLMCEKLIECLGVCPADLKKDVISFIPEIVDNDFEEIVGELQGLMESDSSFTLPILDALSNLSLEESLLVRHSSYCPNQQDSVRTTAIRCLASAKVGDLPVVLKFILRSITSENIVKQLRENLKVSSIPNKDSSDSETLILDVLRSGMRFSKDLSKSFFDQISKVESNMNHRVLDLWVLFVLHGMAGYAPKVEALFRKKISGGQFKPSLLKKALDGHAPALSEMFGTLISLCSMCLRYSSDEKIGKYGIEMYMLCFNLFPDNYYKQEVIGSVTAHIGSGIAAAVDNSLLTLLELTKKYYDSVLTVSAILQGILDFLDSSTLSDDQIRRVFMVFTELTYHNPLEKDATADLLILITKHLGNPEVKYKRIGIIGCITLVCTLGSIDRREKQIEHLRANNATDTQASDMDLFGNTDANNPDEDFKQSVSFLEKLFRAVKKENTLKPFLYDELVNAIHKSSLRIALVQFIAEQMEESFQESFILEKPDNCNNSCALDESSSIVVNFLVNDEGLAYMPSQFRLLQTASRYTNSGSLSSIDALLDCPYLIHDILDDEEYRSLPTAAKDKTILSLYHAINWTKELINAFCTQKGPEQQEIRDKVVERVTTAISLEERLNSYLGISPTYAKAVKKKKDTEDAKETLDMKNLSKLNRQFRPLEVVISNILEYRHGEHQASSDQSSNLDDSSCGQYLTLEPSVLHYLMTDLDTKMKYLLHYQKKIINIKKQDDVPLWMGTFKNKMKCLSDIGFVFGSITKHLTRLLAMLDNSDTDAYILPTVKMMLHCLTMLYEFEPLYRDEALVKEIIGPIVNLTKKESLKAPLSDLLHKSFVLFESYNEVASDFETKVLLLELLVAVWKRQSDENKAKKEHKMITDHCEKALQYKWASDRYKADQLSLLLHHYIRNSPKALDIIEQFSQQLLPMFQMKAADKLEEEGERETIVELLASFHTLTTHSFPTYYKTVWIELTKYFLSLKFREKEDPSRQIDIMKRCITSFSSCINMTRENGSTTLVSPCLRYGRIFLETLIKSIPWLTEVWPQCSNEQVDLFKKLQLGTRQLQTLCAHGKLESNMSLVKSIPPLKKVLETLIFKVKMLLSDNGVASAFWLGNLRHKDIGGHEVSSQIPRQEEEEEPKPKKKKATAKKSDKSKTTSKGKKSRKDKDDEENEEEEEVEEVIDDEAEEAEEDEEEEAMDEEVGSDLQESEEVPIKQKDKSKGKKKDSSRKKPTKRRGEHSEEDEESSDLN